MYSQLEEKIRFKKEIRERLKAEITQSNIRNSNKKNEITERRLQIKDKKRKLIKEREMISNKINEINPHRR